MLIFCISGGLCVNHCQEIRNCFGGWRRWSWRRDSFTTNNSQVSPLDTLQSLKFSSVQWSRPFYRLSDYCETCQHMIWLVSVFSRCVVPPITVSTPILDYGRCFLHHPYELPVHLLNDSDLPAKYELLSQVLHVEIILFIDDLQWYFCHLFLFISSKLLSLHRLLKMLLQSCTQVLNQRWG